MEKQPRVSPTPMATDRPTEIACAWSDPMDAGRHSSDLARVRIGADRASARSRWTPWCARSVEPGELRFVY